MIHPEAFVHEKAHVDADSITLGARTKVWQFASITRGTIMGEDCSVSPFAMLDGSIYGDRVLISAGVACGAGFKVGNDVFLGPNCCLANDMWPQSHKIGYDDEKLRSGKEFAVIIEDGVSIGASAVILPGIRIGKNAAVAAGSVVTRNVPDWNLWRRNGYLSSIPQDSSGLRMRWAK